MVFEVSGRLLLLAWAVLGGLVVVLALLFVGHRFVGPTTAQVIGIAWAGLFAPWVVFIVGLYAFRRHPAARIAELVSRGKVEEACALARESLERKPSDPLIGLNGVAAFAQAGDVEAARRLLDSISSKDLPRTCRKAYAYWAERLKSI